LGQLHSIPDDGESMAGFSVNKDLLGEKERLKTLDIGSIIAVDLHDFTLEELRRMQNFKTIKYKDALYFG